jgi:RNA polymerase-binding transcription factor DksA
MSKAYRKIFEDEPELKAENWNIYNKPEQNINEDEAEEEIKNEKFGFCEICGDMFKKKQERSKVCIKRKCQYEYLKQLREKYEKG